MGFEFRLPEGLVPVCFEGIGSKKKLVQRGPAWFEDEKGKENERGEREEKEEMEQSRPLPIFRSKVSSPYMYLPLCYHGPP